MASASLEIDLGTLASAVADKLRLESGQQVVLNRKDVEHLALAMADCFFDAEADLLNRLRAALGLGPVEKVGSGATRHWRAK